MITSIALLNHLTYLPMKHLYLLIPALVLLISCEKEVDSLTEKPDFQFYTDAEYAALTQVLDLPSVLHQYKGDVALASDSRATLGRVLFYDKSLSKDGTISCASCHKQHHAFSDDIALSKGIYGRQTDRNSLALGVFSDFANTYGSDGHSGSEELFWDTRGASIHSQITETMANEKEMGMEPGEVVDALVGKRHYEILFTKAFGTPEIQHDLILSALERFMHGMTTDNSKYDRYQQTFTNSVSGGQKLSSRELRGLSLFQSQCATCHQIPINGRLFSGHKTFANNGLDINPKDQGRRKITKLEEDAAAFKIPSLRNITQTAPYMHDGRFETLEEVLDFYNEGIQSHFNLDPKLKDHQGNPKRMNFTEEDKSAIIVFLDALTDMSELSHEKFSDPWLE